jgi:hypothetical protein
MAFSDGISTLTRHDRTPIVRHAKVRGDKSLEPVLSLPKKC